MPKRSAAPYKAHPWHGIEIGTDAPEVVNVYVEIVPTDTVKYEVDKVSGHLKVDRPQKYSNLCPSLYGFIPRTYCGKRVGAHCSTKTSRANIEGDGDPMDICVLTEKPIQHGDVILRARPIGGFRLIDRNQADDKIIAVLDGDAVYGQWTDVSACPTRVIERLRHYFLTYKDLPGTEARTVEIPDIYSAAEAKEVIRLSVQDYREEYLPDSHL